MSPGAGRQSGSRPARPAGDLRLAELLAAVSLATDLAHDVPYESALRTALLALGLGQLVGLDGEALSDVYYLALLYHVGCTGAVAAQSRAGGGDDISARRWLAEADVTDRPALIRIAVTRLASEWGPVDRARALAGLFTSGPGVFAEALASVAEVAARLSDRLGASARVTAALTDAYGRWDGRIFSSLPRGDGLSLIGRLVHLVHVAQVYLQAGGSDAADEVVRSRRGAEFDPELAGIWLDHSGDLVRPLAGDSVWEAGLAAEPAPHRRVSSSHLDRVTAALADFVDLRSPYTHGHSAHLASLVEGAGVAAGLDAPEVATLRRAAQVHDVGNVSVPNRVWLNRGSLNRAEWERVRLHAYHSERVLSVAEPLRACGELAGLHHERLDGSGYHRGLRAAAIPPTARILAAAEVFQSMREERSWRPAHGSDQAAKQLMQEVRDNRLDRDAVGAVLAAAGRPRTASRSDRSWPAGLTDREVDVLRVLARGQSNRQIANQLHVSEATVHTHLINVYGKIGVNTRAGATLFALEHDLIQVAGGA